MTSRNALSDFAYGLVLPLTGGALIPRRASLAGLAFVPVLLTVVLTVGAFYAVHTAGDAVLFKRPEPSLAVGFMATVGAWVVVLGWWLAKAMLYVTAVIAGSISARVLSAPVMDVFAQRVLRDLRAKPPEGVQAFGDLPLVKSVPVSIARALGRALIWAAGAGLLFAVSFVPGAGVLTTPLGIVWTGLWLFVDTSLYALQWVGDAHLPEVRALARARPFGALGFACSTGLLLSIPFVGFFATPVAVAGACLLVAEVAQTQVVHD